jgi:hypothetical protein
MLGVVARAVDSLSAGLMWYERRLNRAWAETNKHIAAAHHADGRARCRPVLSAFVG